MGSCLRKKLDVKNHACVMMGYCKKLKTYNFFNLVKQDIICEEMLSLMRRPKKVVMIVVM
jgi:hypothetical protein